MIAHVCDLKVKCDLGIIFFIYSTLCLIMKPGDFVHTLGDAHIYLNHIEPLKEQVRKALIGLL